jgi:hypothetical protein
MRIEPAIRCRHTVAAVTLGARVLAVVRRLPEDRSMQAGCARFTARIPPSLECRALLQSPSCQRESPSKMLNIVVRLTRPRRSRRWTCLPTATQAPMHLFMLHFLERLAMQQQHGPRAAACGNVLHSESTRAHRSCASTHVTPPGGKRGSCLSSFVSSTLFRRRNCKRKASILKFGAVLFRRPSSCMYRVSKQQRQQQQFAASNHLLGRRRRSSLPSSRWSAVGRPPLRSKDVGAKQTNLPRLRALVTWIKSPRRRHQRSSGPR